VWTEIQLLGTATCRHEGLLPLLGYCLDRRAPCLVYPLLEGGDLEARLFRRKQLPLTWWQRLHVVRAAARALHFLHAGGRGIVLHRQRVSNQQTPDPARPACCFRRLPVRISLQARPAVI
jgi:hypothetical protein